MKQRTKKIIAGLLAVLITGGILFGSISLMINNYMN